MVLLAWIHQKLSLVLISLTNMQDLLIFCTPRLLKHVRVRKKTTMSPPWLYINVPTGDMAHLNMLQN